MPPIDAAGREDLVRFTMTQQLPDQLEFWEEPGVIRVSGAVDAHTRQTFIQALVAAETNPCVHALDLSGVEFFSAAGVACFVERGWPDRPHVLIIASRPVRRVLSICTMDYLLDQHGWRHA